MREKIFSFPGGKNKSQDKSRLIKTKLKILPTQIFNFLFKYSKVHSCQGNY